MKTIKVYPVAGRKARHNKTGQVVPAEGLAVEHSPYWARLLRDGDVTTRAPSKPKADTSDSSSSKETRK